MFNYAKFDNLKINDKLVKMSIDGKTEYYTFLCHDPGLTTEYAYVKDLYGEASHLKKSQIESMFIYDDYAEFNQYALTIRENYYRDWLIFNEECKR